MLTLAALKAFLWPVLAPTLGYFFVNVGNMLMGKSTHASKAREAINRVSFTTSRNKPWREVKRPGKKES